MKISYANMKLKVNTSTETFDFGGQQIEVLQYLPAKDKHDLLISTLEKAKDPSGIYNEFKLNLYFELNLVYMYTNIEFSQEDRQNELEIYDNLKSNGFFDMFFQVLNEDEYNQLFELLGVMKDNEIEYTLSAGGIINRFIDDLPANAEAAAKIVNEFDPQKYQAVIDFANAANGGRNFKTNLPTQ